MTEAGMVNHQEIDREAELDELQRHVERALDRARRGGATAAEASAQSSLGLAVTVRLGEVETLEHMREDLAVVEFSLTDAERATIDALLG